MKRRTLFVLFVLTIFMAGSYTVFANGHAESKGSSGGTAKTKITFATNWVGSDTKAPVLTAYVKAFAAKHPSIDLVEQAIPGAGGPADLAKYYTMASANTLPDVFNFWGTYGHMGPLVKGNHLADLKQYIANDPVFSKEFNKSWMFRGATQFKKDGPIYGLPAEFYFCELYVNKKLFDEAGAPLPKTWADVKKAIPLLKAKGITPLGWAGADGDINTNLWTVMLDRFSPHSQVEQALAAGADLNKVPAFREAFDILGQLAKMNALPQGAASITQSGTVIAMYNAQKVAMFYGGTWYMGMIKGQAAKNTIFMPFWTFSNGHPTDPKSLTGGVAMSYVVNRQSWENPQKKAALNVVLHYLESPTLYKKWTAYGVPPLVKVSYPSNANPLLIEGSKLESRTNTLVPWHAFNVPKMNSVLPNQLQGIANGSLTPQQAYDNLVQAEQNS